MGLHYLSQWLFIHREDSKMPDAFSVLVLDSPSIISGSVRGLGIMQIADVIEWGDGTIDTDEFLSRIDFRTE